MKRCLLDMEPERIVGIILTCVITIFFIVLFCIIPKCSCGSFINTAFCTTCGLKNEKYKEPVVENHTGLACPVCGVERHTNYCGDCGSEVVFINEEPKI
jgi:hypothetical protein